MDVFAILFIFLLFASTPLASTTSDGTLSPAQDEAVGGSQHWLESLAENLRQSGAKDVKVSRSDRENETLSSPSSILPPCFKHTPANRVFARNITGRYRGAKVYPLSLSSFSQARHSSFWSSQLLDDHFPVTPGHNQKPADSWRWQDTVRLDMSFTESSPLGMNRTDSSPPQWYSYPWGGDDWLFVEGSLTLTSASPAFLGLWNNEDVVRYDFYGMHHIPNGTINLYALPRGKHILPISSDIPDWGQGKVLNGLVTDLREKMDVKKQLAWYSHMWFNTPFDIEERGLKTECPLSIHMTLPPSANPVTTNSTAPQADYHLSPPGLAGVAIAEGCGWALGFERGKASIYELPVSPFDYIFFVATYLMLGTEPFGHSTAGPVLTLTVGIILLADFLLMLNIGGHGVREKAVGQGVAMMVLVGFQSTYLFHKYNQICTKHLPLMRVTPSPLGLLLRLLRKREEGTYNGPWAIQKRVLLTWLIALLPMLWTTLPYVFHPRIFPLALFAAHSFWIPQILSSAFTGVKHPWNWRYVIGGTARRTMLLLYMFAWESNAFLMGRKKWVWVIIFWQVGQVWVLYQQTRRRPDFLHNFQPTTRPASLEKQEGFECPICHETVILPAPPSSSLSEPDKHILEEVATVNVGQGETRAVAQKEDSTLDLGEGGPDQEGRVKEEGNYAITPCNHV
ncbi:hypothetical protein IAR50_005035 [Cryptococcus sp. DSM 104548]